MIAIVNYNAGNIGSVQNALQRLGVESVLTKNPDEILNANRVILPGVGEASSAMEQLNKHSLDEVIKSITVPFLGICLGLQLMTNHSEEGNTQCLGIFDTYVKEFPKNDNVPHIGWNEFSSAKGKIMRGVELSDDVFYAHSYYAENCKQTIATCNYITPFSSILHTDNFYAMQFHPEKSGGVGERILQNFIQL